jgi:hypothetical protein
MLCLRYGGNLWECWWQPFPQLRLFGWWCLQCFTVVDAHSWGHSGTSSGEMLFKHSGVCSRGTGGDALVRGALKRPLAAPGTFLPYNINHTRSGVSDVV